MLLARKKKLTEVKLDQVLNIALENVAHQKAKKDLAVVRGGR